MKLFGLNRRRSETLLLAIGQLVLIAYVFQIAAFDHWVIDHSAVNVANVSGIAGTSAHSTDHADHCHGAASSCADSSGGFAHFSADQALRLPASNPSLVTLADPTTLQPREAFLGALPQPPRAA